MLALMAFDRGGHEPGTVVSRRTFMVLQDGGLQSKETTMDKLENGTSDRGKAERLLSDSELDAVVGGFVIYGTEASGFIVDGCAQVRGIIIDY